MLKKWMTAARPVTLVAVALMSTLVLTACKTSGSTTPGGATQGSTSATSNVAGVATGTAGQTATGTLSATATAGANGGGNNGSGTDNTAPTLKPFTKITDPGVDAKAPGKPAANGETLAPLTKAPDPTISAIKLGMVPDGTKFTITMRPYGIGPELVFGSRLAILVDSAKADGKSTSKTDAVKKLIAEANLLALADTGNGGGVTKGGTYTATLTFRTDGTKLLPVLSEAKSK